MPNAVGLTDSTARDRLVAAGFKVTETRVFAKDPPGTVVAQDPAAGSRSCQGRIGSDQRFEGDGRRIVPQRCGLCVSARPNATGESRTHRRRAVPRRIGQTRWHGRRSGAARRPSRSAPRCNSTSPTASGQPPPRHQLAQPGPPGQPPPHPDPRDQRRPQSRSSHEPSNPGLHLATAT